MQIMQETAEKSYLAFEDTLLIHIISILTLTITYTASGQSGGDLLMTRAHQWINLGNADVQGEEQVELLCHGVG